MKHPFWPHSTHHMAAGTGSCPRPLAIKTTPKTFRRSMGKMLEGIPWAFTARDNILIACNSGLRHDKIRKKLSDRTTSYYLKLNPVQLHHQKLSVPCTGVGHLLTSAGQKTDPDYARKTDSIKQGTCSNCFFVVFLTLNFLVSAVTMLNSQTNSCMEWTENSSILF